MTKKLLAILISVVLVVSCMAVPVMADEVQNTITLTLSTTAETSPNAYYLAEESHGTASNMSSSGNKYKTFYLNISEELSGDYMMTMGVQPFGNKPAVNVYLDEVLLDRYDVDGHTDKGFYKQYGIIGLNKGEHKLKIEYASGSAIYFRSIELERIGALSRGVYGFGYKGGTLPKLDEDGNIIYKADGTTPETTVRPGTKAEGNDAVFVSKDGAGNYDSFNWGGWAQFKLPDDTQPGWYKLSIYAASNATKTLQAYLGDAISTGTIVGKDVLNATYDFNDYNTFKWIDLGVVRLDGDNNYLTLQNYECGNVRLRKIKLVPFELNSFNSFDTRSSNITNPIGNNNFGRPGNGMGATETAEFDGINVAEFGEYKLKARIAIDNDAPEGSTVTAKLDGNAVATIPITSTGWSDYVTEDFGLINIPSKGAHKLEIVFNATKTVRLSKVYLERLGVGDYINYTMDADGNQYSMLNANEANYGAIKTAFNNYSSLAANNMVTYKVRSEEAGRYKLVAQTATDTDNTTLEVFVNGLKTENSAGKLFVPNSTYGNFVKEMTWYIDLVEGKNTIHFVCKNAGTRFRSFEISKIIEPVITDSAAVEVTKLGTRTDDTFTVSVPANSAENITVIAALYKDGNVVKADVAETVDTNLVATLSGITIADGDKCELKVFYLDSIDNLTPICSYYVVR